MKKALSVVLIFAMAFSLFGCNRDSFQFKNSITENVKIDSLDKLNFYAVKKAVAENDFELLSTSAQEFKATPLVTNSQSNILNLANVTEKININSEFTITMCSYFSVTITKEKGFLAQKLGGTGSVEVVVTRNNLSNMITFKMGERYFSCFETASTENAISFSSNKYAMGYQIVENFDDENYEFTVFFDGDRVVGIDCFRFEQCGNYKYEIDNAILKDNFCFVIHKTQTFTAKQLESLFSTNNAFVNDGVILSDGSVLFGQATVTDNEIAFKNNAGKTVITANDIKNVSAMHNEKFGFCIKLELSSSADIFGKRKLDFYIGNSKNDKVTLQKYGNEVYVTKLKSKSRMSDFYHKLTALNENNIIGNIKTHEDFVREISKKINLNNYNCDVIDWSEETEVKSLNYDYTLKKKKTDSYDKSYYQATIDGITVTFPLKVSELLDMGFTIKKIENDTFYFKTPKGNVFSTMTMSQDDTFADIYERYNLYLGFECFKNCCSEHKGVNKSLPEFEVFDGINKDSTLDELFLKLGEPEGIMASFTENPKNDHNDCYFRIKYSFSNHRAPTVILWIEMESFFNNGSYSNVITDIIVVFEGI